MRIFPFRLESGSGSGSKTTANINTAPWKQDATKNWVQSHTSKMTFCMLWLFYAILTLKNCTRNVNCLETLNSKANSNIFGDVKVDNFEKMCPTSSGMKWMRPVLHSSKKIWSAHIHNLLLAPVPTNVWIHSTSDMDWLDTLGLQLYFFESIQVYIASKIIGPISK